MRTQIDIYCPFGRDVSWITQEICEAYAGASLRGRKVADREAMALSGDDLPRAHMLMSLLDSHPDFLKLKDELIDEYGYEAFIRPKHMLEHIRDLEARMDDCQDDEVYAKLMKELRELRGWTVKPAENRVIINNNNQNLQQNASLSIDTHNPVEVTRVYHSLLG
jgi:hypothetical protein